MLVVRFYTPFAMFAMRLFIPNGFECFSNRCVDDVFLWPGAGPNSRRDQKGITALSTFSRNCHVPPKLIVQ